MKSNADRRERDPENQFAARQIERQGGLGVRRLRDTSGDIPTDIPNESGLYWATLGKDGSKKPRSARLTGLFWAYLGATGKLSGP